MVKSKSKNNINNKSLNDNTIIDIYYFGTKDKGAIIVTLPEKKQYKVVKLFIEKDEI